MGKMFIAAPPRCPVHGQMKWVRPSREIGGGWKVLDSSSYWICLGFDGEGCGHRAEDAELDWTLVAEDAELSWTPVAAGDEGREGA